jgi:DNA-directed RNA polymerase subunit E'/Rpb7
MEEIYITTTIEIQFSELNEDVNTLLLSKAKKHFENVSTSKYGYITEILELSKIIGNMVSRYQPTIIFTIELKINRFLPQVSKQITGTVKQILNAGIYLVFYGMNILVPKRNIPNFENHTYSIGDTLTIEITNIKYENKKYSLIGKSI